MRCRTVLGGSTAMLCLLASFLAAPAVSQAVLDPASVHIEIDEGTAGVAMVTVVNPLNAPQIAFLSLDGANADWAILPFRTVELAPRAEAEVPLDIDVPIRTPLDTGTIDVHFLVFNQETGAHETVDATVVVTVLRAPLLFGFQTVDVPDGLNPHLTVFVLELAAWAAIAWLFVRIESTVLHHFMRRARPEIQSFITDKLSGPIFLLVLIMGLRSAWRLLPPWGILVVGRTVLDGILILSVTVTLYRIAEAALHYYAQHVAPNTETVVDDLLIPVLRKGAAIVIVVGGIYMFFQSLGINLGVLLAGAGIAGLAIGFAAQDTLSNFFSGIFILLDRPFSEGDDITIETGEVVRVDRIGLRSTHLYHYRNHEVIITPNNELANRRVVNMMYPDKRYRVGIDVGVAYGSDIGRVMEMVLEEARQQEGVITDPNFEPGILFTAFGASSLDFTLRCFVNDVSDRWRIGAAVRQRIYNRFEAEGIEIPFPQRTVWMHQAHE